MKRLERSAILTSLIEKLIKKWSWCGETRIQKTTYFLQELLKVPLEFHFILYKHGPFSFNLRDELSGMRADDFIALEPQPGYGPKFVLNEKNTFLKSHYQETIDKYEKEIDFIIEELGKMQAAELERVATAFYISQKKGGDMANRARMINDFKPHISIKLAQEAVETSDFIIEFYKSKFTN